MWQFRWGREHGIVHHCVGRIKHVTTLGSVAGKSIVAFFFFKLPYFFEKFYSSIKNRDVFIYIIITNTYRTKKWNWSLSYATHKNELKMD